MIEMATGDGHYNHDDFNGDGNGAGFGDHKLPLAFTDFSAGRSPTKSVMLTQRK